MITQEDTQGFVSNQVLEWDFARHKEEFDQKGYITLRNFFDPQLRKECEAAIARLYAMQASKIKPYRERMKKPYHDYTSYEDICEIYNMMEEQDKEALYHVHKFVMEQFSVRKFITDPQLVSVARHLIGVNEETALIHGMGLFVNKPGTNRLLYKWHTAEHGYPKRRTCLSVWFPLFVEKTEQNGVMYVAEGSHQSSFPFVEYRGYSSADKGKSNQLTQREIPEELISNYRKVPTLCKPGDVVFFHHSLVHTSSANSSSGISFAGVVKVWDPVADYSLSGDISASPYGNDFGRSELYIEN